MTKTILAAVLLASLPVQVAAKKVPLAPAFAATVKAAETAGLRGYVLVGDAMGFRDGQIGKVPGTAPKRWRWASVSKQIVAVAVMQQVAAGKLDLDTPVNHYAPALKIANADRVTLRQLLQHTSGLPNVEDGPLNDRKDMLVQFLRASPAPVPGISPICMGPAKAEPGARFEYNDCDTEIVGAVLEAVSGQPLATLLATGIFAPLGMTSARLLAPGDDAGRPGYMADGRDDGFIDVGRFGAAGAAAGSPRDLWRFDAALMSGKLLPAAQRSTMWAGDPKLGFTALGQWSYTIPLKGCTAPVQLIERRGGIGGVEIRNVIAPERGRIMIAFDDHGLDYGEPWQGRGAGYELLSAALCTP